MKNISVTIISSTEKAYLVQTKSETTFWIPKGKLLHGPSVTQHTYRTSRKIPPEQIRNKKLLDATVPIPPPSWSSEKSISLDLTLHYLASGKKQRLRIFIPRSTLTNGKPKVWLIQKKIEEQLADLKTSTTDAFETYCSTFTIEGTCLSGKHTLNINTIHQLKQTIPQ